MQSVTKTKGQTTSKEPASKIKSIAVLPNIKGVSEALRRYNNKVYTLFSKLIQRLGHS